MASKGRRQRLPKAIRDLRNVVNNQPQGTWTQVYDSIKCVNCGKLWALSELSKDSCEFKCMDCSAEMIVVIYPGGEKTIVCSMPIAERDNVLCKKKHLW